MTRAFEDFSPGQTGEYGAHRIERDELIAFAAQYDPQPMHLDEAAAARTLLGGLAASGWQSACVLMRLNVDHMLRDSTSLGAPGIEELRWLKPVRPGDTLSVRWQVLDTRPSRSRPNLGFVSFLFELINRQGEVVMTQKNSIMFGRRTGGAADVS